MKSTPDNFKSREFLTQHISDTLAFYEPNIDDEHGGFYQNFSDNGEVFDKHTRHLVSSTRFVFNYARAYQTFNVERYLNRVKSGIEFIRKHHLVEQTGGYNWLLKVESNAAATFAEVNLSSSQEGHAAPVLDTWQTYTFNISDLADAGLDVNLREAQPFEDPGQYVLEVNAEFATLNLDKSNHLKVEDTDIELKIISKEVFNQ